MAQESFAKTVYDLLVKTVEDIGQATVHDLSHNLGLQTTKDHKRMLNTLSELKKAGKVVRVEQGVYALAKPETKPELREVMWRILRMRKRVTVDDLVEMAGASVEYARDWLHMLAVRKVVRKIDQGAASNPRVWQLINDTVEMPVDTSNAARLRDLRKKNKAQALSLLNAAHDLIDTARKAITEMED